jgi:outer membrane protein OmpA-like peptidoglycan-associated protein
MYFQRLEHFDIETIRDRYYWHTTHLVLFAALTFVFSMTELTFDVVRPAREVASSPFLTSEVANYSEVLHPIANALHAFDPSMHLQNFKLIEGSDRIEIHFGTASLYEAGRSDFVAGAGNEIHRLGRMIAPFKEKIYVRVEGHTDDVPVVSNAWKYPSNWELSSARAARVVRTFMESGLAGKQLEAVGRSQMVPLLPNRSPAGEAVPNNQLANRRIVVILKPIQ